MKKMLSLALSVLGVILFIYGSHLSNQATFEEERVSQAEATGQRRPTLGPVRRAARTEAAENKQEMLSEAGEEIATSEVSAYWLRGVGVVLFIVGIGSLVFGRKKKI